MKSLPYSSTPIDLLEYFSRKYSVSLSCKRDDLFGAACGGSKARMLQYILADLSEEKYDILVTAGGPCSNFNRACALMCARMGVPMHLISYTDNPDEYNHSHNYYVCKLAGSRMTYCEKIDVKDTINWTVEQYKSKGKRVKLIYGGGRSLQGIYAYYEAVRELAQQVSGVDSIFVACGTGTTVSGLCAGVQDFMPNTRINAISVARDRQSEIPIIEENISLFSDYMNRDYDTSRLMFYDDFISGGYGVTNNQLLETIVEVATNEGMLMDSTYVGKAFWGMSCLLSECRGKSVLFWNTGGLFNLLSERRHYEI